MAHRPTDPDCIFCRIAEGTIPARVIHETDDLIAFHDVNPQAPVHALIIPKAHYENMLDDIPADLVSAVFNEVPVVARMLGLDEGGFRTITNSGPDSGQTVYHLHVHLIGGASMEERMVRLQSEA